MKPLLLFACLFCSVCTIAQNRKYDSILHQMIEGERFHLNNGAVVFNVTSPANKVGPLERDANGNFFPGVHRLSNDGIPCLVPATKDIAALPNFYKGKITVPYVTNAPRIPNPLTNKSQTFIYQVHPRRNNK